MRSQRFSRSIRGGIRCPDIFNSGCEVWMYDDASSAAIRASGAFESLYSSAGMEEFEEKMRPLLQEGRIVAYSMEGDGGIEVEVIVGEPLTEAELAEARWMEPQEAFLSLPSGRLHLDSNDSLQFNPHATDPGALLDVPPGDYRLTLYRLEFDDMEREGLLKGYRGPREVVTLTPGAVARPVPGQPAILPWQPTVRRPAPYTIADGVCRTQILFPDSWDTFQVGLDQPGLEQLGASDGAILHVEAAGLGFGASLVYLEGSDGSPRWIKRLGNAQVPGKRPTKEWGQTYLMNTETTGGQEVLFGFRRSAQLCIPDASRNVWLPATVRVVQPGQH